MEDENSDDEVKVMLMEMSEVKQENEEKPLISLFHQLISGDGKQSMVLTDEQIKEILKKELDIETLKLHDLEGYIYLRLVKVYLWEWPEWNEFYESVKKLKLRNDYAGLKTIVLNKHKSLRNYLKLKINIAEPMARAQVELIKWTETNISSESRECINEAERPYALEVHCTRGQLNNLFFRHPLPSQDGNMTIFNIEDAGPSKIIASKPTIEGILNTSGIRVKISINSITISRFTCHELSHTLVNRKLNISRKNSKTELKECIQMQILSKPTDVTKNDILNKLIDAYKTMNREGQVDAVTVLKVVMADLAEGPEIFKVPACYRKYMSKYAYKRCLYAERPEGTESYDDKNYDLQLEEMISPQHQYIVHEFGTCKTLYSLLVECTQCGTKYKGVNIMRDLEQHYLDVHNSQEPDATCTNCNETFSFDYLTAKRWHHECQI